MISLLLALLAAPLAAKTVSLKTADGWTLAASYAPAKPGRPTAVLVHGVAAGRGEYEAFASTLQSRGWGTLALDLRGHGGSTAGPNGRRTFEDFDATREWPKAVEDVLAAVRWLGTRGAPPARIALIGGSMGANLCAAAAGALPPLRGLVLLSPGDDYRGVALPPFDAARAVLAFSRADGYAAQTVLREKGHQPGLVVIEARSGHGAQMLADPDFVAALLATLEGAAR